MDKCAAIDTHVVLGYISGIGPHKGALKILREALRFALIVPPSTLADLEISQDCENVLVKSYGADAISAIEDGVFEPYVLADEADTRIVESRVENLLNAHAIEGAKPGDLRVLVEAAYMRCDLLLTTNPILTDADADHLQGVLLQWDVHPIIIRTSAQILNFPTFRE